jgi:hypothetical protein
MLDQITWQGLVNWAGYAIIAMFLLRICLILHAFAVTAVLYRRFPLGLCLRMLLRRVNSPYVKDLFLPLLAAGGFIAYGHFTGRPHPAGLLIALAVMQLYYWMYQALPPAVFLLSTSTSATIDLRHRLERGVHPYRVVVLFDPSRSDPAALTPFQRCYLEWDNFRTLFGDWRESVHALMRDVPLIVLDARMQTQCVLEEATRVTRDRAILRKTIFLVGPENDAPALQHTAVSPTDPSVRTVQEDGLVKALRSAGLRHTRSPDDHFAPIRGLDTRGTLDGRALHRRFDEARMLYEQHLFAAGYWFDRLKQPGPPRSGTAQLERGLSLLDSTSVTLDSHADSNWASQLVALFLQRALIHCELGRLDAAEDDLSKMQRQMAAVGDAEWDPNERESLESRRLFLLGELALAAGQTAAARQYLEGSLAIDRSLGDEQGLAQINNRLAMC